MWESVEYRLSRMNEIEPFFVRLCGIRHEDGYYSDVQMRLRECETLDQFLATEVRYPPRVGSRNRPWDAPGFYDEAGYQSICIGLALAEISKRDNVKAFRVEERVDYMRQVMKLPEDRVPTNDRYEIDHVVIFLAYLDFAYGREGMRAPVVPVSDVMRICLLNDDEGLVPFRVSQAIFIAVNQVTGYWPMNAIIPCLFRIATFETDNVILAEAGFNGPLEGRAGVNIKRMAMYYATMVAQETALQYDHLDPKRLADWNPEGIVEKFFYEYYLKRDAGPQEFVDIYSHIQFVTDRFYEGQGGLEFNSPWNRLVYRYKTDCMHAIKRTRYTWRTELAPTNPFFFVYQLFSFLPHGPIAENLLFSICGWLDMRWLLPAEGDDHNDAFIRKLAIVSMLNCIFWYDAAALLKMMGTAMCDVLGGLFSSDHAWIQILWHYWPNYCANAGVNNPGPFRDLSIGPIGDGQMIGLHPPPIKCVKYARFVQDLREEHARFVQDLLF
jgi:hypothetical protein